MTISELDMLEGRIIHVDPEKKVIQIIVPGHRGQEELRFALVGDACLVNSPGNHSCLARVGDIVRFPRPEQSVHKIRKAEFKTIPDVTLDEFEISTVSGISPDRRLFFGKRQCGCCILLGSNFESLDIGDTVRHKLDLDHSGRWRATQVRFISKGKSNAA